MPIGAGLLFGESIAPVVSPLLGLCTLGDVSDLDGLFLLELDDPVRPNLYWEAWLAPLGWPINAARRIHRFNHYDQLNQAAISGQGVALGRMELIDSLVAGGCLVVVGNRHHANPIEGYAYL